VGSGPAVPFIAPSSPYDLQVNDQAAQISVTSGQLEVSVTEGGAAGAVSSVNGQVGDVPVLGPLVQQVTFSSVITLNVAFAGHFRITLTADAQLANPAGAIHDGQRIMVEVTQGAGGSHHLTYGSQFNFGVAIGVPVLSTTAGKRDFMAFVYNAGLGLWDCVGFVWGY